MDPVVSMRLISLNTWCGRALYPLMLFLRENAEHTDVFCLQEVRNCAQEEVDRRYPDEYVCGTLLPKIERVLSAGFKGSYAFFPDAPFRQGLATFWNTARGIHAYSRDIVIYEPLHPIETGSKIFSARKLQYTLLWNKGQMVLIANFHGLWNGGPKTDTPERDTPERIEQSRRVRHILDSYKCPKILCGDFNLLPDTLSLRILEGADMSNLVREFKVSSTRTQFYRHYRDPQEPNFADYVLVSPEIRVKDFKVLPDLVSDHAPLLLDFEVT